MKITLRKLGIRDLSNIVKTIKNPEVGDRLQYNFRGYFLKGLEETFKRKDTYKFAILADGKFAGGIVLEKPNTDKTSYELGYFVNRDYWGKNVATSAVRNTLQFGFNNLKLKKIWAVTEKDNPASGKVLKKAGFKLMSKNDKKNQLMWEKSK